MKYMVLFLEKRWSINGIKKFKEGEKEVGESKRASKKRKIGEVEKEGIIEVLNSNRKLTTREISNNTGIPKSSVSRILKELGIFY